MGETYPAATARRRPRSATRQAPSVGGCGESASAAHTEALGGELARRLSGGDVVHLRGEIGAGKTTFVRGMARALGVQGAVSSPTFVIAQRYRGERLDLAHVDLYRLADPQAEEPDLLADYRDERTVVVIEWPSQAALGLGAQARFTVRIEDLGGERRLISCEERS